MVIRVFQGERKFAEDNIFLGEFELEGIEDNLAGVPEIEIAFRMDIDGILKVTAKDLKTKSENNIVIKNSLDIDSKKVERLKEYAKKMEERDESKLNKLRKFIDLSLLMQIFNEIEEPILSSSDEITLDEIKKILKSNDAKEEELTDLTRLLRIIIKEQESFKFLEDEDEDEDEDKDDDDDLI